MGREVDIKNARVVDHEPKDPDADDPDDVDEED